MMQCTCRCYEAIHVHVCEVFIIMGYYHVVGMWKLGIHVPVTIATFTLLLIVTSDWVATHVYVPAALCWMFIIVNLLSLVIVSPSGLHHFTLGVGLELDTSQSKSSVPPSLMTLSPVITGALKTEDVTFTNDNYAWQHV